VLAASGHVNFGDLAAGRYGRQVEVVAQLSVTMQDVFQDPQLRERGIVVIDDGNVTHLAALERVRVFRLARHPIGRR
jgi:hypothetical protein